MLPPSNESVFNSADSSAYTHRHEPPHHIESSSCARPQMAWQMYEHLLRIASQQQQQQSSSASKDVEIDSKRVWLAAFTGPSLMYRQGVAAGAAEPL